MRKEVKIGLLAIVAIGLSIWGYKFIKGKNLLTRSNVYTVYYEDASGLTVGTPVLINGVSIGAVSAIELQQGERSVEVLIDLQREYQVPKSTIAYIQSTGIMGGKAVSLEYDEPCTGDDCLPSGSVIRGNTKGMLASFLGDDAADQYMEQLKSTVNGAIDTLNQTLFGVDSDHPIAQSSRSLEASMANMQSATARLDRLLANTSGDINATMSNLSKLTASLEARRGQLENILSNADSVSSALVAADIEQTIGEITRTISDLRGTLDEANRALAGVTGVVEGINEGEGTLGKLLQDDQLYNRINRVSNQADSLITDFQDRPYRYVPFKSRSRVKKFDRKDEAALIPDGR